MKNCFIEYKCNFKVLDGGKAILLYITSYFLAICYSLIFRFFFVGNSLVMNAKAQLSFDGERESQGKCAIMLQELVLNKVIPQALSGYILKRWLNY